MFDAERIRYLVSQLQQRAEQIRSEFASDADKVLLAAGLVQESWSGSSLGHHAEIYFRDFGKPIHRFSSEWGTTNGMPPGWSYKTAQEVTSEISRHCSLDLHKWSEEWDRELDKLRDLRDDLAVEFSHVDSSDDPQCLSLIAGITTFEFSSVVRNKIATSSLNAHMSSISRDIKAISARGVAMPSQIYYDALANEILMTLNRADDVAKVSMRALRCLELAEQQRNIPVSPGMLTKMREMMNDPFTLLKNDGKTFSFKGLLTNGKIISFDSEIPFEDNDIVERKLPGNRTERYQVLDIGFHAQFESIDEHFQMKVRKDVPLLDSTETVKNVTNIYNVSGHSARVNLHAVDSSSNVVQIGEQELFQRIRHTIQDGVADHAQQQQLLDQLGELELAKGTPQFAERFQSFISVAANCMTLLGPFLPALATLIGS